MRSKIGVVCSIVRVGELDIDHCTGKKNLMAVTQGSYALRPLRKNSISRACTVIDLGTVVLRQAQNIRFYKECNNFRSTVVSVYLRICTYASAVASPAGFFTVQEYLPVSYIVASVIFSIFPFCLSRETS